MRWMYSPQADETQQVWFKRSIHMGEPTASAVLSIGSEGRCIVYVNGFNLLTKGTNTIAVWYSPVSYGRRQLYAVLTGEWQSGRQYYIADSEGWLCHAANARTLPDGNEEIDGRAYLADWKDYNWQEESFLFSAETTPPATPCSTCYGVARSVSRAAR